MLATQTENEFIFVNNRQGERVGTYSTRSHLHMHVLTKAIGDVAMNIIKENVGKTVDLRTMEVSDNN